MGDALELLLEHLRHVYRLTREVRVLLVFLGKHFVNPKDLSSGMPFEDAYRHCDIWNGVPKEDGLLHGKRVIVSDAIMSQVALVPETRPGAVGIAFSIRFGFCAYVQKRAAVKAIRQTQARKRGVKVEMSATKAGMEKCRKHAHQTGSMRAGFLGAERGDSRWVERIAQSTRFRGFPSGAALVRGLYPIAALQS